MHFRAPMKGEHSSYRSTVPKNSAPALQKPKLLPRASHVVITKIAIEGTRGRVPENRSILNEHEYIAIQAALQPSAPYK